MGQILRQLDEGSEKRSLENFVETKVPGTGGGRRCSDGRMKMNDCPGVRPSLYLSQKNLEVSGPAGLAKKKGGNPWEVKSWYCKLFLMQTLEADDHLQRFWLSYQRGKCLTLMGISVDFLERFNVILLAKHLILESLSPYNDSPSCL